MRTSLRHRFLTSLTPIVCTLTMCAAVGCGTPEEDDGANKTTDTATTDAAAGSDAGATDAGEVDAGASDVGPTDSGTTDTGPADVGVAATCEGAVSCAVYNKDQKACTADSGCTPAGFKCTPKDPTAQQNCPKLNTSANCSQGAHMGCKWAGTKCLFVNSCYSQQNSTACAAQKLPCLRGGTTCTGDVKDGATCDSNSDEASCAKVAGCSWKK